MDKADKQLVKDLWFACAAAYEASGQTRQDVFEIWDREVLPMTNNIDVRFKVKEKLAKRYYGWGVGALDCWEMYSGIPGHDDPTKKAYYRSRVHPSWQGVNLEDFNRKIYRRA